MTGVTRWAEVGDRVRQARLAAGLSQSSLASNIGIDRSALARVEGGDRHLSALELFALADELRLPLSHFVSTSPAAIASHRQDLAEDADEVSRTTFRLDALVEAHARDAEWLRDQGFLTPAVALFPATRTMGADNATFDDARHDARTLREALGLDGPVGGMADVLARLGLHVLVADDLPGGASLLLADQFGVAVIGGQDDAGRRRMTAAHELGHFVLQDEYRTDLGVSASRDEREQRIEAFAAEFLLPGAVVEHAWETATEPERARLVRLAATYRVSWTVAVVTARHSGLVTMDDTRRLLGDRPRRGEFLEVVGTVPEEDLPAGQTSGSWRQAAIAAWKAGAITSARAVELVYGAISETDLPDRTAPEAS